jgi:phospholipid/cholesterol/gamma-HCH transport system substrate-binding protein
LHQGQALIYVRLREKAKIPDDSRIVINSSGFLGSRYIEIVPGASKKFYSDGDRFEESSGGGDISSLTGEMESIAKDVKAITANLREIFGTADGEQGIVMIFENLQRISSSMGDAMEYNQANFNKLVGNLERFTANMAYLSDKNRQDLSRTMSAFPAIAENLNVISANLATLLTDNNQEIGESLKSLALATARLEEAMDSVRSIAQKIDEGEGTIGKLVNEGETADNLNEAVQGINDYIQRARRIQTTLAYRAEYDPIAENAKSTFNLTLQPRKDRFYLVGVVDSPAGRTRTTDTVTKTTTNPGQSDERVVTEQENKKVNSDQLLLNAQYGKRWHDFVFRGGLLESSAGAGVEYYVWKDNFRFMFEAYDFDPDQNPALKAGMDFTFFKHFMLTAGVDDFINRNDDPRYYFGGGIKITDEDVSVLFSRVPLPDI